MRERILRTRLKQERKIGVDATFSDKNHHMHILGKTCTRTQFKKEYYKIYMIYVFAWINILREKWKITFFREENIN